MTDKDQYHRRKAAHQCVRCGKPAAVDSDFCPPHEADARARAARAMKKRRAEFKKRRRCTCGRKRKGQSRLCARCLMRLGLLKSGLVNKGVNKRDRIKAKTIVDRDGRSRYLGKGRRGAPTTADNDRESLTLQLKAIQQAFDGLDHFESAEVQALPRIQREDVRQGYIALSFGSAREGLLMCKRGGWTIPGLNDDSEDIGEIAATGRKSRR